MYYVFHLSRLRVGSSLPTWAVYFCCFNVEIRAAVLPMICGLMWVLVCFGLLWLLLGFFGHDRAKNDSGIDFPYPRCELLVLLRVCSGWYSDCVGMGMKAWFS